MHDGLTELKLKCTCKWDNAVCRLARRHPEAVNVRLLVVTEQILQE